MGNAKVRIGILGWGSLIWEDNREFDAWHDSWQCDGPSLKIEFSRISTTRLGALTLVIDPEHGCHATVAWCLSKRKTIEDAIADLRRREGTTIQNIGYTRIDEQPKNADAFESEGSIIKWAREKGLSAVVWTALKSNFQEKVGAPFSVEASVAYVKTLDAPGKAKAAEYVWRAPELVQTAVRSALQQEPWFSKQNQ